MTYRKKLIEVALPLEEINKQSAREKSIRHGHLPLEIINEGSKPETENPFMKGHPRSIHNWWARTPLSVCRAVVFASLVDDPGEYMPDKDAHAERQRLFYLIEELVNWDNINNEKVLGQARLEIARSVARDLGEEPPVGDEAVREFLATKAPPVLDPFCGRGSIPLEAQRLGLRAYASDLNPVAVLITKALIEIPPKFAGRPPVHPPEKGEGQRELMKKKWRGAQGLAEDVRYYGRWMRDQAEKRIGHLYPPVKITAELLAERPDLREQGLKPGDELTVIAWLWARCVPSPNPLANGAKVPLIRSFWLSKKNGKEAWIEPLADMDNGEIKFKVRIGDPIVPNVVKRGTGTTKKATFECSLTGDLITTDYIRECGQKGLIDHQMMAIVAKGASGRIYLDPISAHEDIANKSAPEWKPEIEIVGDSRYMAPPLYGLKTYADLFTPRQLVALTTFSDLVKEARQQVLRDALAADLPDDGVRLEEGGAGAQAYSDAVAIYLACAVSRLTDYSSAFCSWNPTNENVRNLFQRQAIPMVWDYSESNTLDGRLSIEVSANWVADSLRSLPSQPIPGSAFQMDAQSIKYNFDRLPVVSTDPPYYDNISYADISDFFYVWLRRDSVGYFV